MKIHYNIFSEWRGSRAFDDFRQIWYDLKHLQKPSFKSVAIRHIDYRLLLTHE